MRLNKFISESGLCSRREADRYIAEGHVFINGRRASIGDKVFPNSKVMVNGQMLEPADSKPVIFIALNKPVGITSTTESHVEGNIIDFVNHSDRIFPIGRLDKDSQGLILLTNEGDVVNKILRAGNRHEKEYVVTVNKPVTEGFIQSMSAGVPIDGVTTKKCQVKQESAFVFRIILVQGLNRQIRKMCEYLGYEVTKLERVRVMNITLKGLALGDWRELSMDEVYHIYSMIKDSSSEDGSAQKRNEKRNKDNPSAQTKRNVNPDNRSRFKKHGQGKNNGPRKKNAHGGKPKHKSGGRRRGR